MPWHYIAIHYFWYRVGVLEGKKYLHVRVLELESEKSETLPAVKKISWYKQMFTSQIKNSSMQRGNLVL